MNNLPTKKEVLETLFSLWQPLCKSETIPLDQGLGRILTTDVLSLVTVPVVRASAMDGVGVAAHMFAEGLPSTTDWQLGVDFCRADTGDDFDDKFDAVIPIEKAHISAQGKLSIDPDVCVEPGLNIRPSGSIIKTGDILAKKHRQLRSFDLACLALGGITEIEVFRRPVVAFIPTGSELVPLGAPLCRGKNIDSNSVLAKHMLIEAGAEPLMLPIVADNKQDISAALQTALKQADIVLLNGGSSKGEEDYNGRLLEEMGVALFHWVAAAPGKPLCLALIEGKPVINIPGPPVALLYVMEWCVSSLVCHFLHKPLPRRQAIKAVLSEDIVAPANMEILCLMDVKKTATGYETKQKPWRGGNSANSLGAGAYYITKLGLSGHKAGETLEVELLRGEEDFS